MHRYVMAAVFFIGLTLILAVAVPNVIEARNRSMQKRTMADLRSIGTAWEARATNTNSYDIAGTPACTVEATAESFGKLCTVPAERLARVLEPTYIKHLPRTDGWGSPLDFRVGHPDAKGHAQTYAIRSPGSDQRIEGESYIAGSFSAYERDLIYSDGSFLTYPGGL